MADAMISLAEKVAVITGAGAGLGRGIAEAFAQLGAAVIAIERDPARAANIREWLQARNIPHRVEQQDVCDGEALRAAIARGAEQFKRLDILVNNVGDFCGQTAAFANSAEADWQTLYEMNFKHVLRATHAALPPMRAGKRGGSIINISTIEAHRGMPGGAVYSAFNAAISGFTRSLALEVAHEKIRVNEIAPETSETEQVRPREWVAPEKREHIASWIPLGRFGTPRDAAGCAVFLASELSAWITGATIHLDGGALAAGGWRRMPQTGRWTNTPIISGSGM